MSYKPLENVTIVFSTANITVCADEWGDLYYTCLLYTSPSPRD